MSSGTAATEEKPQWRDLPWYQRVVIRRRLEPEDESGFRFTDIKGIAYHISDDGILLQPEFQQCYVYLEAAEIEAAKPIPPRPERHRTARPAENIPETNACEPRS